MDPPPDEGENLRSPSSGELDRLKSDDFGGGMLLSGIKVQLESLLTYTEDVRLLLTKGKDVKPSSSKSEYLISTLGNGTCLDIFLVLLECLEIILGK